MKVVGKSVVLTLIMIMVAILNTVISLIRLSDENKK